MRGILSDDAPFRIDWGPGMALDANDYDALTFDCYGTLIDWALGISQVVQPIMRTHDVEIGDDRLFEMYLTVEADIEGGDYKPYRKVLRQAVRRLGTQLDITLTNAEAERFADSVGKWPPFPDTNDALRRLQDEFRLAVISNVDDDLFHETARHFSVSFDEVITGEQVGAYKPDLAPFETAFTRLGVPPNRMLHVAQSVYHDLNPAGRLGIDCVWLQRYGDRFDTPSPATEPVLTVSNLSLFTNTLLS